MKYVGETGRIAYKYRFFGWHITISNSPVKFKQTTCAHQSVNYRNLLRERRRIAGDKCERCGRDLTVFGRLYHMLPMGAQDRSNIDNLRFVCNSCYKAIVRNGAPVDIMNNLKEGGAK